MKKLIGLLSIVVVLVLGSYYGMGIATERAIKHHLQMVNKTNGVYAKVINYSRHWFTSDAILEWEIQVPEHMVKDANGQATLVPAENYTVKTPITIHHGPIIFANKAVKFGLGYAYTDVSIPSKFDQQFVENFTDASTKPKLNISVLVTYLSKSKIQMIVPEFTLIAKKGGQFDWLGIKNTFEVSYNNTKVEGNLQLTGFKFAKDDTRAVLNKLTTDYKLHKLDNGLYLGSANLSMPLFGVYQKDVPMMEATELNMVSDSDISGKLVYSNFQASLSKLIVNKVTYGPAKIKMSLKNLDAEVLARMNEQATKAQQGSDVEKQQLLLAVLPEIPKLFSQGAEFQISTLTLEMPQGKIDGNLLISLPMGESTHPLQLIQKIHGQAHLTVPIEVVKMLLIQGNNKQVMIAQSQAAVTTTTAPAVDPNATATIQSTAPTAPVVLSASEQQAKVAEMTNVQLNNMVQSGLVVQHDQNYQIDITFDQGALQVNGQPFNPKMMQY